MLHILWLDKHFFQASIFNVLQLVQFTLLEGNQGVDVLEEARNSLLF